MNKPLVTVICLCYNHAAFVQEAISSVLAQDYQHIELIVVDDCSTDQSGELIRLLQQKHGFKAIYNDRNLGNCRSFNLALSQTSGAFVIDLAADDVLFPERVKIGVELLEMHGERYGVHFCDVQLIDEHGKMTGNHYRRDAQGQLLEKVPQGDIFVELLQRYFISAPSMMMRRSVLDELGGYDENLSYEDFDFWVRSSRYSRYAFTDQVLVKKRILYLSLSRQQKHKKNRHALSTAVVCQKAAKLQQNEMEKHALIKRINHELKWALLTENWEAATLFLEIKNGLGHNPIISVLHRAIIYIKPRWYILWKL
ncbi:MAG: glycosyltransferase [Cyclobacteriaceae bacterium]|nr:glycosyltransferase [Cyclobacteriaceae bacterium]